MSKILLVYDDFAELNATELSLKKSGFDVIGLTNEYTIKDQIVTFNPDILVGFGNTQRVGALSVGRKLKEMNRWMGKSILIFPKGYELPAEELIRMRMDMLLESPISVIRLIQIICKLLKLDEKQIIEKLAKSFAKDRNDDLAFASYDSDTVKVIQHIQGELENMEAERDVASSEVNASSSRKMVNASAENAQAEESRPEFKKNFFDNDSETSVTPSKMEDPFAALISELKGESKEAPTNTENLKPAMIPEEVLDFEVVGKQIKDEIAQSASELGDKMKKYAEMSSQLHLYPESTIKKVKAKKQLNDLKKDWNTEDLEGQDKARREFVTQLFNPKK